MNRSKKQKSLFEAQPALIREWHPTANDKRTPKNMTVAFPKKVWWICSAGHEWQATIKSRLKLRGCSICEKEAIKEEPGSRLKTELIWNNGQRNFVSAQLLNVSSNSRSGNLGKNFRRDPRFKLNGIAVIEVPDSGHWLYAEMTNISKRGLAFETEVHINPGIRIIVQFKGPYLSFEKHSYKSCSSIVKWSKKLDMVEEQSVPSYRIGAEIFNIKRLQRNSPTPQVNISQILNL